MIPVVQKSLIPHYLVTGILLVALSISAFKIHRFSDYDKQLFAGVRLLQSGAKANTITGYSSNFQNNIEKQLVSDPKNGQRWINYFKQDSVAYPGNVMIHAFTYLVKFNVAPQTITMHGDTAICDMLIRDKTPFIIRGEFIRKGNIFLLDNLDNIGALYNRLDCYRDYLGDTTNAQVQHLK